MGGCDFSAATSSSPPASVPRWGLLARSYHWSPWGLGRTLAYGFWVSFLIVVIGHLETRGFASAKESPGHMRLPRTDWTVRLAGQLVPE